MINYLILLERAASSHGRDYTSNAAYYVTIVTKNRVHFFGGIKNGEMVLSEIGQIANNLWYEIPIHQPNIKLDAFIIMPNHIHCIVVIDKPVGNGRREACLVPTLPTIENIKTTNISPKPESLATIIGGYKSAITKNARKLLPQFNWQPRFYDRIIRDEHEFNRIRNYIVDNPKKWNRDGMNNNYG